MGREVNLCGHSGPGMLGYVKRIIDPEIFRDRGLYIKSFISRRCIYTVSRG